MSEETGTKLRNGKIIYSRLDRSSLINIEMVDANSGDVEFVEKSVCRLRLLKYRQLRKEV